MSIESPFHKRSEKPASIQDGKFAENILKDLDRKEEREYKSFKEAAKYVMEHQSEGLPHERISRFKSTVSDKLWGKLGDKVGDEVLRFYSAKDSILDRKHGIDAFFTLGENNMVTLDFTLNTSKLTHKADVIVHLDDLEGLSDDVIDHYSDEIVDIFVQNIQDKK